MTVAEPVTLLTDALLAIIVGWLGFRLLWLGSATGRRSIHSWGVSFLGSALAAALGGTWHGFHDAIGSTASSILWKATMLAIGTASVTLVLACLQASASRSFRKPISVILLLVLAMYVAQVVLIDDDFLWAIALYAPAMLAVAALMIVRFETNRPAAPSILTGIAISFAAAAIQQSGMSLHRHFSANDLYHVIQATAFWFLYRGGRRLEDHDESAPS